MMNATEQVTIKVLLVDDSPIALVALKNILATDPGIEVVGTARNGREALELVPKLEPTVICTDLYMPVMDGLELTRKVMESSPRPILVVSVGVREDEPHNAFDLLAAGALDVFPKPRGGLDPADQAEAQKLVSKVRKLAGVVVFRRKQLVVAPAAESQPPPVKKAVDRKKRQIDMVAIGASTGGPQALMAILPALPASFPVPVICIQHISQGFLLGLVRWLDARTRLRLKVAENGEQPQVGHVYFPPEGHQLLIGDSGQLVCSTDSSDNGHVPSADVTFNSVAAHFRAGSLGILLSGMGSDGARGLKAIADVGGITLAQDEESSVVFGMPGSAEKLGAVQQLLPLTQIATHLIDCVVHDQAAG